MTLETLAFRFRDPETGGNPVAAYCYDIVISGRLFTDIFPDFRAFVSPFALGYKSLQDQIGPMDEFTGIRPPDDPFGVPFLICSECHDRGCGGIWGRVEVTENLVTWNNFSEGELGVAFRFERSAYMAALENLRREITEKHAAGLI